MEKVEIKAIAVKGATVHLFRVESGFEVVTTTGYRAQLPGCECGRPACLKKDHSCSGCHGGFGKHQEHAEALAVAVSKTYGSGLKGKSDPSAARSQLHTEHKVKPMPKWEWEQTEWAKRMESVI